MSGTHKTVIGKDILLHLMFNIYPDQRTIYREYIQNACDAISTAKQQGLLTADEPGRVSIAINPGRRLVEFEDNGVGIPTGEAEARLKDVAKTTKKGQEEQAGFYGIGRLVGAGYCERLCFRTSAYGENIGTEVSFDTTKIQEILDSSEENLDAGAVIDECSEISTYPEEGGKHYMRVSLQGIKPEYGKLLDEEEIYEYIRQTAPIPYATTFLNNILKPELQKPENRCFAEYYAKMNQFRISLNDRHDLTKRYGLKIEGTNDEIAGLRFFRITDSDKGDLAWGWYAITPFTKQIPQTDSATGKPVRTSGMRLRIHNIQIGDERTLSTDTFFKEPRGNKYFNGEVHIVNLNIFPTTDRSGIAPTGLGTTFLNLLAEFGKNELSECYKKANELKNSFQYYVERKQKLQEVAKKNAPQSSKTCFEEQLQASENTLQSKLRPREKDSVGVAEIRKLYTTKYQEGDIDFLPQKKEKKKKTNAIPQKRLTIESTVPSAAQESPLLMQEILTQQLSEERSRVVSKVFELLDMYTDYFNPNMLEKIKNAIRHEFPSVSK